MSVQVTMTQKTQQYERGGHRPHLLAGPRLVLGEARLAVDPLARIGALFPIQMTCTLLWGPHSRVRSSPNVIASLPRCYQSYQMPLLRLGTVVHVLTPLFPGAPHDFVKWLTNTVVNLVPICCKPPPSTPQIDPINFLVLPEHFYSRSAGAS